MNDQLFEESLAQAAEDFYTRHAPRTPAEFIAHFTGKMDTDICRRAQQEADMDIRTPPMDRAEAKLNAEIALTDDLRRRVGQLPGSWDHDATAHDLALGVALRAFSAPHFERERKMLAAMREALRTTDPEKEVDLWEQVEMAAYGMRREAEERDAASRDPITGRIMEG